LFKLLCPSINYPFIKWRRRASWRVDDNPSRRMRSVPWPHFVYLKLTMHAIYQPFKTTYHIPCYIHVPSHSHIFCHWPLLSLKYLCRGHHVSVLFFIPF
jgi:hypothetical protein